MKEELFIDTYLLTNWLLNLACLYTTQTITKGKVKAVRALAASFVGALYAVFSVVVRPPGWVGLLLWLLVLIAMVYWVNAPTDLPRLVKAVLLCFLLATALGGILEALRNLFYPLGYKTTLIAILLGCGFCITGIRLFFLQVWQKANLKRVGLTLKLEESQLHLTGMVDSGNLLCEPITGHPVILIGARHINEKSLSPYFQGCPQNTKNFYIIPARTASGSMLVYGRKPTSATLILPGDKRVPLERVIVAADSRTRDYAGCDCLVPSTLIP